MEAVVDLHFEIFGGFVLPLVFEALGQMGLRTPPRLGHPEQQRSRWRTGLSEKAARQKASVAKTAPAKTVAARVKIVVA